MKQLKDCKVVFDLKQENARLRAELDQCRKKEEDMQNQIKEAVFNARLAAARGDRNEQYSRRNNVKLLYIPEVAGAFESAEESDRKALQMFHDRLGLKHIKPEHTEACLLYTSPSPRDGSASRMPSSA